MPDMINPQLRTVRGPSFGRVRTLEQVGRIVHGLGLSTRPLVPREVLEIERRALRRVESELLKP